jgi:signal peptidase II
VRFQALIVAVLSFIVDRVTKLAAEKFLSGKVFPVIPGFFDLRYAENRGAAFSIFSGSNDVVRKVFLLIIPVIIAVWILYYILFKPMNNKLFVLGLGLILGGAIGNLYDRIIYGKVIDFLDFYISFYHWPTFNVADVSVFVGCLLVLFSYYRR